MRAPVAGLLVIVLLGSACKREPENVLESRFEQGVVEATYHPGTVLAFTADLFKVKADGKLLSAKPASITPGLEVVDVRATYLVRSGGRPSTGAYIGSKCWTKWPPVSDVGYPRVQGLSVTKGDQVAIMFFVRAASTGHYAADGVELHYAVSGKSDSIRTHVHKAELTVVAVGDELPVSSSEEVCDR